MVENLSKVYACLSEILGEIVSVNDLKTSWTDRSRQNPLLFTTSNGKFVYHPSDNLENIVQYKPKLDGKNKPHIISSPIVEITEEGFITQFIEGVVLRNFIGMDISSIAQLQAKFHYVKDYDLTLWNDRLDKVYDYLLSNSLLKKCDLPKMEFSRYGLIHGDYSPLNLVKTQHELIAIDLEHVLEGPIAFDLARPILRICSNQIEESEYLDCYFRNEESLSKEELRFGKGTFFLMQTYDRHRWGYPKEAQVPLNQFMEEFK